MYTGRRTIRASYNGACRGCDKKITKGDVIFFQGPFKSWHVECWKARPKAPTLPGALVWEHNGPVVPKGHEHCPGCVNCGRGQSDR